MDIDKQSRIGQTFGKCKILRYIGRGGMGTVWLGEHLFLRRPVAIKILHHDLSNDPEEMARFEREAIAAARLDHENIVRIHDVDEDHGRPFIVNEFIDGEDLEDVIRKKSPLPVMRALNITRIVAKALEHSHEMGVVHRDIKPGNILIGKDGRIKITDFGLAREVGHQEVPLPDGTVLGTPFFASPEQIQGLPADGRTDIYSLGVTLYTMLTGRRPFGGRSPDSVVKKHLHSPRPSPRLWRTTLSRPIEQLVMMMMAVDPRDRHPSARALRHEIEQILREKGFLRARVRK
ncbi:MAG TPA: serine/threonine-protein kinase [Planctomycetota bacterium]|nr:serine/threonine-protein kinase [Planctomycetota bacterium]